MPTGKAPFLHPTTTTNNNTDNEDEEKDIEGESWFKEVD